MKVTPVVAVVVAVTLAALPAAAAPDRDRAALAKLVKHQVAELVWETEELDEEIYLPSAVFTVTGGGGDASDRTGRATGTQLPGAAFGAGWPARRRVSDVKVGVAADGKTAWVSFAVKLGSCRSGCASCSTRSVSSARWSTPTSPCRTRDGCGQNRLILSATAR